MVEQNLNKGYGGGEGPKELHIPETVVKDTFSSEFRRGISFREWDELQSIIKVPQGMSQRKKNTLEKMLRGAKETIHTNGQISLGDTEIFEVSQDSTKIVFDQTQMPPLYILTLSDTRWDEDIAKCFGKEMGYQCSSIGVVLEPNPCTKNLHVDYSQVISTLKDAGVSTSVSGKELIDHFKMAVKHRASIYEIEDEDKRREEYAAYHKGNMRAILLAKQDGLDVYLELGQEAERRLLYFKSGDNLDISGTTLTIPLLSHHVQAANEAWRIEYGMILPAIDIMVVPTSKEGKIDHTPPNFDPQTLAAGRDLTARITTAFEALKPKA